MQMQDVRSEGLQIYTKVYNILNRPFQRTFQLRLAEAPNRSFRFDQHMV